jgi:hypothetical protein
MINYTVNSTDPFHYNTIKVNLPNMTNWQQIILSVSSLVTQSNIAILEPFDYIIIVINDKIHQLYCMKTYVNFSGIENVIDTLNELLKNFSIYTESTAGNRILFKSTKPFKIAAMTYNMQLLTGMYDIENWPVESVDDNQGGHEYHSWSVGFLFSTPILYLLSTLGDVNIHNSMCSDRCESHSILMRIQNSFSPAMPLIASNAEFTKKIVVGDIANFECCLVDANLHEIHLLSPMWVSFTIQEAFPDDRDNEDFWKFNFTRAPRKPIPPSELIPLNPELLQALNEETINFS